MPYRCYSLDDEKITFDERTPKGELQREFGSPPGILRNAQNLPLSGWCRISPTYRDLPADASPAIRSLAKEVFARLCYRHELEVHDVEGGRYAFRVEHLVEPNSLLLKDYRWYYGIGVYQRTDPKAADPASFGVWDYPAGTKLGPNAGALPMGTGPKDVAAIGKSKGIPCVTGRNLLQDASGKTANSGYPSWVIALGLAAAGGAVYFLTRSKSSTFKSNSAKRNGFKVRTGDLVSMGRLGDIDEQQGDKVAVRATSGWDHEVRKFASRTAMKDFLKKEARKSDHGAHGKRDWQALVKDVVAANNVAYPSFQKEDRR